MPVGRPKTYEFCTVSGCHKVHYALGMCQPHYRKHHRPMRSASACEVMTCQAGKMTDESMCFAHVLERIFLQKGSPDEWLV